MTDLSKRHRDTLIYITRESANGRYHNAPDIYRYLGYVKRYGDSPKGKNNNMIADLENLGLIQWNIKGEGWEAVQK
ncbi:MAG TPA: hypothetical protein VL854_06770 [Nitrososphaeraceae archaeon]|nr:hypothetical protein [Nitrososphaeraceae archaeon]